MEGEELNVLKSINLNIYQPRLISVEIHNQNSMYEDNSDYFKKNRIYKFLISKKYKIVWKNQYSFIFKKKF